MNRDDIASYLTGTSRRRQILREILAVEEEELGVRLQETLEQRQQKAALQRNCIKRLSSPTHEPVKRFSNFIRAPRSLRGKGQRSNDVLFTANDDGTFWLYASQKVTHSTLPILNKTAQPTVDDIRRSSLCQLIQKQVDQLMAVAATKERCGLIFDLVSTSKIISGGVPHEVGAFIYEYVEAAHFSVQSLKFVFVGITDNDNCCTARDVFCRDEILAGKYVGDTKRPFDALDNVHMFTVFPGHRTHPLSKIAPLPVCSNGEAKKKQGSELKSSASPLRDVSPLRSQPSPVVKRASSSAGIRIRRGSPTIHNGRPVSSAKLLSPAGARSKTFLTQSDI
jgi:hypothetical protein